MKLKLLFIALPIVCISFFARGQNRTVGNNNNGASKPAYSPKSDAADGFNKSDENMFSNGNRSVAIKKLETMKPADVYGRAKDIQMEQLSKNVYKYLGAVIRLKGIVMNVRHMPPVPVYKDKGPWYGAMLLVKNANDPKEYSNVEFAYKADDANLQVGSKVTIAGYFTGTYAAHNHSGDAITAYHIMGNYIK